MKTFPGYQLITPGDLHWRPSNLMKVPEADSLERTGSWNGGALVRSAPLRLCLSVATHNFRS